MLSRVESAWQLSFTLADMSTLGYTQNTVVLDSQLKRLFVIGNIPGNNQNTFNNSEIDLPDAFNEASLLQFSINVSNAATATTWVHPAYAALELTRGGQRNWYMVLSSPLGVSPLDNAGWACTWINPFQGTIFRPADKMLLHLPPVDADATPTGDYNITFALQMK